MDAVVVEELTKVYDGVKALDKISFTVREGEIFGLIGPNGAGKTTTLRILATLIKPTSGRALVFGHDVMSEASIVREIISYLPEEAGAYRNLSGIEYLEFIARFYAEDGEAFRRIVEEGVKISGLGERLRDKVKTYSKGMKRRLQVARTLMVKPRLAILDEPTAGLDVVHAFYVREIIKEYASTHGVTVLLSSHNMLEVEYLCNRVAMIDKGRILCIGTPKEILESTSTHNLEEAFMKVVSNA